MTTKRGEITSTQLTVLILALVGFIILLVFLYTIFNNQNVSDSELCRVSVLTRATAPDISQASLPLKCRTSKICISLSGKQNECPQFIGESNVENIRLSGDESQMRNTIEQTLANNMYDCWKMMGTGKLDLYGSAWKSFGLSESDLGKATCVICTRVALGNDVVAAKLPEKVNLGEYLKQQKLPPDYRISYLDAFTDMQFNSYPSVEQVNSYLSGNDPKKISVSQTGLEGISSGNQLAIVFAQNKPKAWQDVATNWAYGIFGTELKAPGGLKTGLVLGLAEAGIAAYSISNAFAGEYAAAVQCRGVVASESVLKESISNDDRFRHGCSLIQTLPYNVRDINTLCAGGVQSIP